MLTFKLILERENSNNKAVCNEMFDLYVDGTKIETSQFFFWFKRTFNNNDQKTIKIADVWFLSQNSDDLSEVTVILPLMTFLRMCPIAILNTLPVQIFRR